MPERDLMNNHLPHHGRRQICALIVDDAPEMRSTLELWLRSLEAVEVVVSAGNGMEALMCFDHLRPELVLTDYEMPGMNGLQLARALRLRNPGTKIIITSTYERHDLNLELEGLYDFTFISKIHLPRLLPGEIARLLHDIERDSDQRC